MDFITRKLAYIWLKTVEISVNFVVFVYALIYKKSTKSELKKIATYWNNPPDITGSNLRMGKWKDFFEKDGYIYHNYYINKLSEVVKNIENGNWTKKYFYFSICILRRLPQILLAHKYDCIWIDRGIIPFYPRKSAFIEKQLKKVVSKLVIDTTDGGDYLANPELMEDTLKQADSITVGYKYQKEFYSDRFKVNQIFWTIPIENYIIKKDYNIKNIPVIGWMGSPANFTYVQQIIPQLKELAQQNEFIFRYICRKNFNSEFEGLRCEHHFFENNYYEIISSFDIGISPFLEVNLRTKGKIAMKHQEFLLMGIPQVCSPVAISEFIEDGVHAIISKTDTWSKKIKILLDNDELRQHLGQNSIKMFNKYYTYDSQYVKLKNVLTKL